MDFQIPVEFEEDLGRYKEFLSERLTPYLNKWYAQKEIPRDFFRELGDRDWLGLDADGNGYVEQRALKLALMEEYLGIASPGVGVAVLVHVSLGTKGITLFGTADQKSLYLPPAARGQTLICVGNTEPGAGSDVAGIASTAQKVDGGWLLNGTKSYVTNGYISDLALVTAVSDPDAPRNARISMFLVDLSSKGVNRSRLHKEVWVPSDLTRIQLNEVFVPEANLIGRRGRGLQQVLEIFTNSRITISALTLGTAEGAFRSGIEHAKKRRIFGRQLIDLQAKSFEAADFYCRIEAARLMLWKTCWKKDQGVDFRLEASMAKYLSVELARAVGQWAADLFGAASVVFEHPIHKYPMDAWASSLGEGTQDVQKLIIFREFMKQEQAAGSKE
ncbi:MAG TPA: acyl-CoA dehydrogenase family protein [Syntrophobacteraceae bacterium]|nr:acyl-CoA dehydrogenase family protein [Syntrophobacteraceae bacterium]